MVSEPGYYNRNAVAARVDRLTREKEEAMARAVNRDPCVGCAVPADRHDEHGCKQYIPRR